MAEHAAESALASLDIASMVKSARGREELVDKLVRLGVASEAAWRWSARVGSIISPEDLEQSLLLRLLHSLPNFQSGDHRALLSYVEASARSVAFDAARSHLRQRERVQGLHGDWSQDDDIARLLSELGSRDLVVSAFRSARDGGDSTVVSVMAEWLRLAEVEGAPPSNRSVGRALGLSHVAVGDALERARQYIDDGVSGLGE